MTTIQAQIEARLAEAEPEVEVLLAEVVGDSLVRLYIDHPDGVTLDVCERVTGHLAAVRERYALEVSSPGPDRPLTKPDHYRRFLGQRARVRTRDPLVGVGPRPTTLTQGRRSFTGELVGASDDELTLAADDGVVTIPYSDIQRSNLLGD
jgi:ribosome maturation factor RimP